MGGKPVCAGKLIGSKRAGIVMLRWSNKRLPQEIPLPAHFSGWQERVSAYEARIKACWKTYERRNRELAHLASNLLILLALVYDCRLICGENLTTLKTQGRGREIGRASCRERV